MTEPAYFTSLPREYYLEQEIFARELERVFSRQWLYFGHTSEIPAPGDYLVQEIVGESVIVVRDARDRLHGFLNVCRHRGYQFCEGPRGNAKRFTCPYHRWTYDLDGRLVRAPSLADGGSIDYGEWGLHRVHLEEWKGFMFVCLSEPEPSPLEPELSRHSAELAQIQPECIKKVAEIRYVIDANWKLFLENYLECYHCRGSHPEFCVTLNVTKQYEDLLTARNSVGEYNGGALKLKRGVQTLSMDGRLVSSPLGEFRTGQMPDAFSVGFSIQPALSRVSFHVDHGVVQTLRPITANQTEWINRWFVHEDAEEGSDYERSELVKVWDITNRQDIDLVEGTQRGVSSRRYVPGPLSASREPAVASALQTYLMLMDASCSETLKQ